MYKLMIAAAMLSLVACSKDKPAPAAPANNTVTTVSATKKKQVPALMRLNQLGLDLDHNTGKVSVSKYIDRLVSDLRINERGHNGANDQFLKEKFDTTQAGALVALEELFAKKEYKYVEQFGVLTLELRFRVMSALLGDVQRRWGDLTSHNSFRYYVVDYSAARRISEATADSLPLIHQRKVYSDRLKQLGPYANHWSYQNQVESLRIEIGALSEQIAKNKQTIFKELEKLKTRIARENDRDVVNRINEMFEEIQKIREGKDQELVDESDDITDENSDEFNNAQNNSSSDDSDNVINLGSGQRTGGTDSTDNQDSQTDLNTNQRTGSNDSTGNSSGVNTGQDSDQDLDTGDDVVVEYPLCDEYLGAKEEVTRTNNNFIVEWNMGSRGDFKERSEVNAAIAKMLTFKPGYTCKYGGENGVSMTVEEAEYKFYLQMKETIKNFQ